MSTPRFDIVDVTHTLRNNRKTILIVSVVAAVLGAAFYLISQREYKAIGSFIMTNPLYTDRNNLFQENGIQFVDYFAGDDDVDKLMSLVEADTVKYMVADKLNLWAHYKLDASKPKDVKKLLDTYKDNYKVIRSEYNACEVSFIDTEPATAAGVVNETMRSIESIFRGYYVSQRAKMIVSLEAKINEMDSSIIAMTDTLASLRDKYKVYDIINPARQNLMVSSTHGGGAGYGWAMEQVQNISSLKDQMVADRARYTSRLNEYRTTSKTDDIPLLHITTSARPPVKPKPPGLALTILSCGFIGLFFSSIYVLIRTYYRSLIAMER
ncbi:MAG: hypothetical protein JNK00_09820 [Flavipsychrobacter sp.]|nr:hypothetical protein [Flavipsychrobacter sp.]